MALLKAALVRRARPAAAGLTGRSGLCPPSHRMARLHPLTLMPQLPAAPLQQALATAAAAAGA
jgi:hypothetical protein